MRKKLHIILIATVLLAAFAACGNAKDSENTEAQDNTVQVSETVEPTQKPKRTPPPKATPSPTPRPQEVLIYAYEDLGNGDYIPFYLNNNASRFLTAHGDIFPMLEADNDMTIQESWVDDNFDSREMKKNPSKFGSKLVYLKNVYLNEIYEGIWTDNLRKYGWTRQTYLTELYVIDQNDQYYYVLYLGKPLDGVLMGDQVDVYGLPLDTGFYDNVSGGRTNVIILAGAKIIKQ